MVAPVEPGSMRTLHPRGFSLIEILVVLAIVSIALTTVSLSLFRPASKTFDVELQRLERIIELTSERAILLGREHRLVMASGGYRIEERFLGSWRPISVSPFQARPWSEGLRLGASQIDIPISASGAVTESEVVLSFDNQSRRLQIDAVGKFQVAK